MRRAGPALALAGVFGALAHALNIAFGMTWEILWAPSSASPNIVFLLLTAVLVVRFLRTGGPAMLRMMGNPPGELASPAVARNTHAWAHLEAGTQDTSARCSPEVVSNSLGRCPKCGMELESRASREDR
jgi:hypothetical protein